MSFDTLNYYIFFPLFLLAYWAFPSRWRIPLLLVGSYYFYACIKPIYLILIIFSTLVDYLCSNRMEKVAHKKKYLWLSLASNLTLLSLFKYLDFGISTVNDFVSMTGWDLVIPHQNLEFPIGISFYTLQTLSYTFDVYRGVIPAEKNIFRFSLFVCFFPQLVAGPLERAGNLLPQFEKKIRFNYDKASDGVLLIVWGLIKKTVISDRLILIIDDIFENTNQSYTGMHFALTGFMISAKFYCDFSGYSDIAIGSAKIMGFDLSRNFDFPFLSTSITKFWRRWHITLSSWFHDYVYTLFPFDRGRIIDGWRVLAILVVFALSGLWHGPAWTFIFWGSINGLFCILYIMTKDPRKRIAGILKFNQIPGFLKDGLSIILTNSFVGFSMIFFMSPSMKFALNFIYKIKSEFVFLDFDSFYKDFGIFQNEVAVVFWSLLLVESFNFFRQKNYRFSFIRRWPAYFRWPAYVSAVLFLFLFYYEEKSAFSYFYY